MAMKVVRAPSSTSGSELLKKPGLSLPPKLLDRAVMRLCIISLISGVSTVLIFAANSMLQPEAMHVQRHPVIRLLALALVLISCGFFGLQRSGWFSKQTILYLGGGFQVLVAYAISLSECALGSSGFSRCLMF